MVKSIGEDNAVVTTEECKFCHSESVSEDTEIEIMTNGILLQKWKDVQKINLKVQLQILLKNHQVVFQYRGFNNI